MQEDTTTHPGDEWLTVNRSIDQSTIGYSLARFHQQVVQLFSQVVGICKEKGLIEFDLLAIDSVKMRANGAGKSWGGADQRAEALSLWQRRGVRGM